MRGANNRIIAWLRSLAAGRPSLRVGVLVSLGSVALATVAIFALKRVAPVVSLSVVYLPAVALVSVFWGLWLGLATALLSAAAFNFFHLPPVGRFTISDSRNWVALAAFVTIAAIVSTIANVARARAEEAELRRREADLVAGLARELLAGARTEIALRAAAHRVAEALVIPSAALELGAVPADDRRDALPLFDTHGQRLATLLVPKRLPAGTVERIRTQVVPSLEALIAVALDRDAAQADAVETAALRRSDDLKTALLQAISHDLRTPVTAILAGAHALRARSITDEERAELSAAVVSEGERLSALIDKLLDLSRLQAGGAEPRREWTSLEDVVFAAQEGLGDPIDLRLTVDPDVAPIRVDAAQLERAFANLLENAWRYSGRRPVSVHVRQTDSKVLARVVDQGPGIARAEQTRIFEPFYRGADTAQSNGSGSGLGLAIAKGFIEANGGTIAIESLPGQGTCFVVSFEAGERATVAA
ncbi:MAG TPA: ATP-binding protein [Solirubrobacteraceae bacterium]|jgi:two-component system sensor histidine kinase KdpD